MAKGKPRRTAMVNTLQALTRDYFEDDAHSPLDYAIAWTQRGRTIVNLAQHITHTFNGGPELKPGQFEITRDMLMTYLKELGGDDVQAKLVAARREGAHGMVEEGVQTLDDGSDERDTSNANVRRLEARERLAAVWNKAEFAKAGGNTNVFLSFGQMHLDALRSRALPASATISQSSDGAQPVESELEPEAV